MSRLSVPYWMFRRFLGAAGRPLDGDELVPMEFATPRRTARVLVRKNQSDLLILWQMFVRRFYELSATYALDKEIETLDTIVDLGGNTGLAASYLTARYRPRTLLTVEPVPENAAVLRRNAALSPLDWIVEETAAAGAAGTLEFTISGYWAACTGVPEVTAFRRARPYRLENRLARPGIRVPAVSVDDLLERNGIAHVDLLKVDIEGAEADIFGRPQPWMDRVERVVLEVHDRYIDGHTVRATLRTAGFTAVPPRNPALFRLNPVELYIRDRH
ncbi:FkbM family methyltransferase [Streptomyces alanosinicus]|uniref:FkbM family methyltransferase n=1 Tax=Streptomyces alanosinicus TaxID=68171 RepID=UPI0016730B56|nr:FkbM family methyltransferase [Streptomyces alanosinicus]